LFNFSCCCEFIVAVGLDLIVPKNRMLRSGGLTALTAYSTDTDDSEDEDTTSKEPIKPTNAVDLDLDIKDSGLLDNHDQDKVTLARKRKR